MLTSQYKQFFFKKLNGMNTMMWDVYLQGLFLGMALILPIGPQNTMIINLGINRQYPLLGATLCFISDLLLIYISIFGGTETLHRFPKILLIISIFGFLFLLYYSFFALKNCWCNKILINETINLKKNNWYNIILPVLSVTWLNPHVYLDTMLVIGSLGSQLTSDAQNWFASGTISASLLWFYGLAMFTTRMSSWLIKPNIQRIIQFIIGFIMLILALKLAFQSWNMFLPLFLN